MVLELLSCLLSRPPLFNELKDFPFGYTAELLAENELYLLTTNCLRVLCKQLLAVLVFGDLREVRSVLG